MEKKISVKTLYLLLVISIGLIGLGVGSTYAVFTTGAEIDNPISLSSNLSYESFVGEVIEVTVPAGETVSSTLNITNSSDSTLNYIVWYLNDVSNIEVGTNSSSSGTPSGSLEADSNTSVTIDVRNNGNSEVIVTLGISSGTGSIVLGDSMVSVSSEELEDITITLLSQINDLYIANYDSSYNTAFADGSGMNYYAPNVRLMNDGLDSSGNMTNDPYTGNIRYYGTDDSNLKNYIYFNCSDYNNQSDSTCEKWRIVGIVDGKVKIIKNENVGQSSWDQSYAYEYYNYWERAAINPFINDGYYYSDTGIIYYMDDEEGSIATRSVSFENIGINDVTRNNNLVLYSEWHIDGLESDTYDTEYPDLAYRRERQENKWKGNVALPYLSDYVYATDLNDCKYELENYQNCVSNNWMYNILKSGWFLSPDLSNEYKIYMLNSDGSIVSSLAENEYNVIPTLYLNPDITVEQDTDGSENNPYKIILPPKSLKNHIINLYTQNYDSSYNTSFGDGTGMNYYAPNVRLMNDGHNSYGNMASKFDIIGNIRYFGSDDSNLKNYIYFNCSNYNNQNDSTCEKWRIVGVVDGKVKIMGPYIGDYAWNSGNSIDWTSASLNGILNEGDYYISLQEKNRKTLELISTTEYYIETGSVSDKYAYHLYYEERNIYEGAASRERATWNGNIALLYPSDYGYAVDLNNCSYVVEKYDNCISYNWMYNLMTVNGSKNSLLLNTNHSNLLSPSSLYVGSNGKIGGSAGITGLNSVMSQRAVVPTLYLESTISVNEIGDGSSDNPYRLVVK